MVVSAFVSEIKGELPTPTVPVHEEMGRERTQSSELDCIWSWRKRCVSMHSQMEFSNQ